MVERPLEVDAGERVFVSSFRLEGVGPTPPEGISSAEIEALLDSFRVEKQGLDGIGADGFMNAEVAEITKFMSNVVVRRDLDMQFDDYQALVDRLRLEHLNRRAGLTMPAFAKKSLITWRNVGCAIHRRSGTFQRRLRHLRHERLRRGLLLAEQREHFLQRNASTRQAG